MEKLDLIQMHYAPRGNLFRNFIKWHLKYYCNIPDIFLEQYVSPENMKYFNMAFTSKSFDPVFNYEWLEQIGDAVLSGFFVTYLYERFPILRSNKFVKVVSQAKQLYLSHSKQVEIANELKLWDYITCSKKEYILKKDELLEDVFEAFIGAITFVGNKVSAAEIPGTLVPLEFGPYGYTYAWAFLKSIYDKKSFDFRYETLIDAKTRLFQIAKSNSHQFKVRLQNIPAGITTNLKTNQNDAGAVIYLDDLKSPPRIIGFSQMRRQIDAEKAAAQEAIDYIQNHFILNVSDKTGDFIEADIST